jgi:hypothetical protein
LQIPAADASSATNTKYRFIVGTQSFTNASTTDTTNIDRLNIAPEESAVVATVVRPSKKKKNKKANPSLATSEDKVAATRRLVAASKAKAPKALATLEAHEENVVAA